MKRLLIISMALMLMLSLASPAFAADEDNGSPEEEWYSSEDWYFEDDWYYEDDWYFEDDSSYLEEIKNTRISLGGTAEGLAVMYNGAYLTFPTAQPEYAASLTMVPIKAFMEALGGEVTYVPETNEIKAVINGVAMNFTIGSATLAVTVDGVTQTAEMAHAAYVKGGAAYAPLKAICDSAGYDLVWDDAYETAVILDPTAILNQIDADFTIMNKMFAMSQGTDETKTYRTICNTLIRYTELNSLDGDTIADMTLHITTIQNGLNQEMTVSMNMDQMIALLTGDGDILDGATAGLFDNLSACSMDVILNMDEACVYVRSNLFQVLDGSIDENTWVMFAGEEYLPAAGSFTEILSPDWYAYLSSPETLTVGAVLYGMNSGMFPYEGVFAYQDLMAAANEIAFLKDGMFVKNGDTYTMKLSLDHYEAYLTALYGADYDESAVEEFRDRFKELDVTLTISDKKGAITASGDFLIRENPEYMFTDTRYSGSFTISPQQTAMKMEIHAKNQSKLLIDMKLSIAETKDSVAKAPPAGSTIIRFEDLMLSLF